MLQTCVSWSDPNEWLILVLVLAILKMLSCFFWDKIFMLLKLLIQVEHVIMDCLLWRVCMCVWISVELKASEVWQLQFSAGAILQILGLIIWILILEAEFFIWLIWKCVIRLFPIFQNWHQIVINVLAERLLTWSIRTHPLGGHEVFKSLLVELTILWINFWLYISNCDQSFSVMWNIFVVLRKSIGSLEGAIIILCCFQSYATLKIGFHIAHIRLVRHAWETREALFHHRVATL